jgi:hypothetical protein
MAERPTTTWRTDVAEHAEYADLFPEPMIVRTDEVLAEFEAEVAAFDDPSDDEVFAAVENVVLALNVVNEEYDESAYETDERELLCSYIDATLTEAGIDVAALAARRGLGRYEITDKWRDW